MFTFGLSINGFSRVTSHFFLSRPSQNLRGYWPLYIISGQASLLLPLSLLSHSPHQDGFPCLRRREQGGAGLARCLPTGSRLLVSHLYLFSISLRSLSEMELLIIFQTLQESFPSSLFSGTSVVFTTYVTYDNSLYASNSAAGWILPVQLVLSLFSPCQLVSAISLVLDPVYL